MVEFVDKYIESYLNYISYVKGGGRKIQFVKNMKDRFKLNFVYENYNFWEGKYVE